jgi:serine/threonine protein kinase
MEYVHGQDLRAFLAKAGGSGIRVPIELGLTVVAGAAAGLNHAHERRAPDGTPLGIVHRDVSPSNIMIGYDGSVKVLDFGIAGPRAPGRDRQRHHQGGSRTCPRSSVAAARSTGAATCSHSGSSVRGDDAAPLLPR